MSVLPADERHELLAIRPSSNQKSPEQAEAKDELGTHARQHQVVRQSLEDIDLMGRSRLSADRRPSRA